MGRGSVLFARPSITNLEVGGGFLYSSFIRVLGFWAQGLGLIRSFSSNCDATMRLVVHHVIQYGLQDLRRRVCGEKQSRTHGHVVHHEKLPLKDKHPIPSKPLVVSK